MSRNRCLAQALTPGGWWKSCIREAGHLEKRHVWVEAIERVGGRPRIIMWTKTRDTQPIVAEILLPSEVESCSPSC